MEGKMKKYTLDGTDEVELHIARDQATIADEVCASVSEDSFVALVLIGGYGRGEGGYHWVDGKPAAYNDYDYFLVVRGMSHRKARLLQQQLQPLAHRLSEEIGVEVDLAVLRSEQLNRLPFTLMHSEMQWGHRVVAGDTRVLRSMPAMPFDQLGKGEFVRLMNNRGALLLLNAKQLASKGEDMEEADRAVFFKYLYKAVLACGDALLAANDSYHPSYLEKLRRIQKLNDLPVKNFIDLYSTAVEEKFHPDHGSDMGKNLKKWQNRVLVCWLNTLSYFESRRLGTEVSDWNKYSCSDVPKGQLESSSILRNLLISVRDFGISHSFRHLHWSLLYPRERLIAVLPGLLSCTQATSEIPRNFTVPLGMEMKRSWSESVELYLCAWGRYA